MKKKNLCFCVLLLALLVLPVRASGYRLQFNRPTTAVGNEFLLRLTLKDDAWNGVSAASSQLKISYNSDELVFLGISGSPTTVSAEDEQGVITIETSGGSDAYSLRLRFLALKSGDSTVTLSEATVQNAQGREFSIEPDSTVVTIRESGDDTSLCELSVVPGTLSPAFSPSVHHYELSVPSGTAGIQVTARPNGYYATAFVEGHWGLQEGHNFITIDMTSASGVSALYTIDVSMGITTTPTPTPATDPKTEPTPAPSAAPTPEPTPQIVLQDTEETLNKLSWTEEKLENAQTDVQRQTKIAKLAVIVAIGEFVVIVILGLYLWNELIRKRDEDDED